MALGTWVNTQLVTYGNGMLKEERKDRLDEIGLRWRVAKSEENSAKCSTMEWNDCFELLVQFVKDEVRHGNCVVSIFAS
jgi:hypothetical protein